MVPFLTSRSGQCGERPDQPDVHFDDRKLQRRAEQLEQGAFGRAGEDEGEGEEGREEEEKKEKSDKKKKHAKSKDSHSRHKYKKILRNKTVSTYSSEDLNAILGVSPRDDDSVV